MSRKQTHIVLLVVVLALFSALTVHAQDGVTVNYMLWDTNQLPVYQQCADKFQEANPGIAIKIEQLGWNDYWTAISTGFVSGTAPDVFTNHLAKYPQMVQLEQIVDLQPLIDRDSVATDIYYPGLADLWTRDGMRFGLPKDWDTIAIVYNKALFEAAGVDPAIMTDWTWNPDDGGTFGEAIAKLTLDVNGNNGLSPDFDKENIKQYGWTNNGMGGPYGQTELSWLTYTTGWKVNNGIWGTEYYFDDPTYMKTVQWMADIWLENGFSPKYEQQTTLQRTALFQAGNIAMISDGSWMIGTHLANEFEVGFGRLPAGPEGRKSMFNGLADSIWIGSQHQEESWQWIKFMASAECQDIVGDSGVVFPAIPEAAARTVEAHKAKGADVSAFLDQANEENGTFLFPITDHADEINTIMTEAMDNVGLGKAKAVDALPPANEEVNALFQ